MRLSRAGVGGGWMAATVLLVCAGALSSLRCDTPSTPLFVEGASVTDSEVPELEIVRPEANISISQGQGLLIEWRDSDRDSSAIVSFSLVDVDDPTIVIPLVDDIEEDLDGIGDRFTASSSFVPLGTYTLRGRIDDGVNRPVTAVAVNRAAGLGEVIVQIVEQGTTSIVNRPPQVFIAEPGFNLAVSQDDVLVIVVQPTRDAPNLDPLAGPIVDVPFDPDSTSTLYVVLDLDDDPLNDNVVAPVSSEIISLIEPQDITSGDNLAITIPITVDLEQIPIRDDGSAYHIRATITDGLNAPVHAYASGTVHVVRAATGKVDLGHVGKTVSGALFRGFNPGSWLGTRMVNIQDFDLDGIDDFVLVAQYGNPRNFGNIGEAYLIYGMNNIRFGGEINVNSTARTISGVIFEGAPPRPGALGIAGATTMGITDVTAIPDLSGDGRPELLIGCAHAEGVFQGRDDDPDDDPPEGDETVGVAITLRQGGDGLEITIEDEDEPVQGYFGVEDTVISSGEPDRNFRAADLEWVNRGANDRVFTLIKFKDIVQTFPPGDTPERITGIGGDLLLTVRNRGGPGTVHELFRDFNAASVTFNNFLGGGAPVAGIHYVEEEIDTLNADDVGDEVTVDVDELLLRLTLGDLPGNEIRLIIVPAEDDDEDADDSVLLHSSEATDFRMRPRVEIEYDREVRGGPFGCYPDPFANNFSDEENLDAGRNERKFEALGYVALLHSENRDNDGLINLNRLEDTIISLELVGQRPIEPLENGVNAFAEADEDQRIDGCRFQAGWYDFHDHLLQEQPPLNGWFGHRVSWIEDLNVDQTPEIIISSPRNELDHIEILANFGFNSTHWWSRAFLGSITVIPGNNYDDDFWRDKPGDDGCSTVPRPIDEAQDSTCDPGRCDPRNPVPRCGPFIPSLSFEVFAEDPTDFLGGARSAGDFNLDSVPDILCGAPLNDRSSELENTGAVYIIYGRSPVGDIRLSLADDPFQRPPMLRIRGESPGLQTPGVETAVGDGIGWRQEPVRDVNGDRIDDVMFSSPTTDFILPPPDCESAAMSLGLDSVFFNSCRTEERAEEVFVDDVCKPFDFNNDRQIDDEDRAVFECLVRGGGNQCCPVDNGYVGIIFGGVDRQGDRTISQLGTSELAGVVFYGTNAGDRAGYDISSAGDFDKDGFGDILITAPGEIRVDDNGRERMGVVYLIFGGPHLEEQEAPIELSEIGGRIPGIVFLSPYVTGAPDEAPTDHVGLLGDINNDGFSDIAIGIPRADLLDDEFPQGEGDPNATGRRPDQGDAYIIYGNNIGG